MTVYDLEAGHSARLKSFLGGDPSTRLRLMEMGLVRGAKVQVRKRAPFGGPIELRVDGYILSIRTADAKTMAVELAAT
ncbi:MAG: ferrous iron transport protein A [Myxococcales bacterium]|nr:ferrous iron transport protein A [Myxococcales bacterium]